VNGCFRRGHDGLARATRGNERVGEQPCGLPCHRWRMGQRAGRVGEPQRGAFGHAWMIDMRPVWRGVSSKVPVDEGAAVRRPRCMCSGGSIGAAKRPTRAISTAVRWTVPIIEWALSACVRVRVKSAIPLCRRIGYLAIPAGLLPTVVDYRPGRRETSSTSSRATGSSTSAGRSPSARTGKSPG
jgi:hypothetical protein